MTCNFSVLPFYFQADLEKLRPDNPQLRCTRANSWEHKNGAARIYFYPSLIKFSSEEFLWEPQPVKQHPSLLGSQAAGAQGRTSIRYTQSFFLCLLYPPRCSNSPSSVSFHKTSDINYPEVFLKKMNIGEVPTYFTRHSAFHVKCNDFPCKINDCNKFHFKAGPSWVTFLVKSDSRWRQHENHICFYECWNGPWISNSIAPSVL